MKKNFNHKVLAIMIMISSLFMGIGYSAINSITLDINSHFNFLSNKNIFISNVEIFENTNANGIINLYDGTYLDTSVELSNVPDVQDAFITFSVTLRNNTEFTQEYVGTSFIVGENTYDNENIIFEVTGIIVGDQIQSKTSKTLLLTFKYRDSSNITSNILNSKISFNFKNAAGMKLNELILLNEETSNSGLYSYENKHYFGGSTTNNYIWFNCQENYNSGEENCERWRIISIENDGGIKIIKDEVVSKEQITTLESETDFWLKVTNNDQWVRNSKILADGKVIFDYKKIRPIDENLVDSYCLRSSNGCNAYSSNANMIGRYKNLNVDEDSMIKKYLDTVYYSKGLTKTAKESIQEYTLPIGLVGINNNLTNVLTSETSITCNSQVGLLNLSDYIFTSNNDNCKSDFNRYASNSCIETNWLMLNGKQYILANGKPLATDDKMQQIWTIKDNGAIYSQDATNEYYLRPVVVLKNNIMAIGTGNKNTNDEYKLIY